MVSKLLYFFPKWDEILPNYIHIFFNHQPVIHTPANSHIFLEDPVFVDHFLVGGLEDLDYFSIQLGILQIPTDFHEPSFFRGVGRKTTKQIYWMIFIYQFTTYKQDIPMTYPDTSIGYPMTLWKHFQWKPPAAPRKAHGIIEAMSLRQPLASVISARFRDRPWGGSLYKRLGHG